MSYDLFQKRISLKNSIVFPKKLNKLSSKILQHCCWCPWFYSVNRGGVWILGSDSMITDRAKPKFHRSKACPCSFQHLYTAQMTTNVSSKPTWRTFLVVSGIMSSVPGQEWTSNLTSRFKNKRPFSRCSVAILYLIEKNLVIFSSTHSHKPKLHFISCFTKMW